MCAFLELKVIPYCIIFVSVMPYYHSSFPFTAYSCLIGHPTSIVASDSSILGNVGWWLQGNWSRRDKSEVLFGPDKSPESIPQAPVASEAPSDVASDSSV